MAKTGKVKIDIEFNQPAPEGRQIKSRSVRYSKYYDDKGKLSNEDWTEEVTFEDAPEETVKSADPKVVSNNWKVVGHTNDPPYFNFVPDDEAVNYATGGYVDGHMNHVHFEPLDATKPDLKKSDPDEIEF